jgi:hypothetical protein
MLRSRYRFYRGKTCDLKNRNKSTTETTFIRLLSQPHQLRQNARP